MKNKKKLSVTIASLALVGAIGIGATLAYFTDKDAATNVITMGHVDIDLVEEQFDEDTNDTKKITNVKPGDTFTKDPKIIVSADSERAYVRTKLEVNIELKNDAVVTEEEKQALIDLINIDKTKWVESDGYYYYQGVLNPGDELYFFSTVTIPSDWGNKFVNAEITIDVKAEAIQSDNFTPTNGFTGWDVEEIEEYVAPVVE